MRGGYVQKRKLVRALLVIAGGDLHRISRIPYVHEADALDYAAGIHVETGYDSFG